MAPAIGHMQHATRSCKLPAMCLEAAVAASAGLVPVAFLSGEVRTASLLKALRTLHAARALHTPHTRL
jgi:hypothetical protein